MEITRLETVTFADDSPLVNTERDIDLTMLQVHTDTGLVGLGETFPQAGMEQAALLGPIADEVLGRNPENVSAIHDDLRTYFNYYGHAGAEMRAMSALDLALWDLKGQVAGQPIYKLLGGACRDSIPTYNTCYDDTYDFRDEPVELAESLLADGIDSMKLWPFDEFAEKTRGQRISDDDLAAGLEPIRRIHEAVGDRMDFAVEFHGLWALTPAKKLARAVEPYDPIWVEDLIRKGNFDAYAQLDAATDIPLCISERLIGEYEFTQAIDTGAVDIVMPDLCWTGGLSTGKAVASLAEAAHLPVAPHNSGGPALHFANAHLSAAIPNLYLMESIRDRYDGWHRNLVTEGLDVVDGQSELPSGAGIGTELDRSILEREDVTVTERAR
ncbi:mandelate racemase/muconate lactonizing enzyme family protein [Halomicroarcula sp. GCM10025817]|uniref:mandelate racemase/muconate lactonizing enzyme family protein n=1 Tax=Haloarcula TaxID=2237 RepID=UPI0023E8C534|nr:mandelate racemase/muconate lactonizing enzyme family protein [Halomicroarcula sp. SYNS111]